MKKLLGLAIVSLIMSGCTIKDNLVLVGALAKETVNGRELGDGLWLVTKVVDGDTVDVRNNSTIERVRLIGVNAPESVDPRRPVECFGKEAAAAAKNLLDGKLVKMEIDKTQGDRDKFGRLLRYVTTADNLFYNLEIIKRGYGHEYTYKVPYKFQKQFKAAQAEAQKAKRGLWADGACGQKNVKATSTPVVKTPISCLIKGNINSAGAKIYHLPSCPYYKQTAINPTQGEKFFCTESEAIKAGWRKAANCK